MSYTFRGCKGSPQELSKSSGTIVSPNFNAENYPASVTCEYNIIAGPKEVSIHSGLIQVFQCDEIARSNRVRYIVEAE